MTSETASLVHVAEQEFGLVSAGTVNGTVNTSAEFHQTA
jgi:hypothetical protein